MRINLLPILLLSLMLSACGGGSGGGNSPPASATSSSNASQDANARSTTILPKIEINSGNNVIVNEPKVTVTMKVTEYDINNVALVTYDGLAGAEYRGSSSQYFNGDKKSLGIETRDATGQGIGITLLGMPVEEDWVLLAPFSDKTMMRDTLVYSLARDMGDYASRWKYFDLYLNNQYMGIYILLEKIKRDPARVDISHLKVTDNEGIELTGGYIIKIDKASGEDPENPSVEDVYKDSFSFASTHVDDEFNSIHHFIYREPKSENITGPQKDYIQKYVGDFENALAGADYKDEVLGYRNFIEVDSFVDYFILNELSRNVDGFNLSLYMFKDKNKKLSLGPVWDFNLAFGNALWCGAERTDGWAYNHVGECPGATAFPVPFWWNQLLTDPYFSNKIKTRWTSLRSSALSDAHIIGQINSIASQLKNTPSVNNNYKKWPILNIWVWPNWYNQSDDPTTRWYPEGQVPNPATYDNEVDQLKRWVIARTAWLDSQFTSF